MTLRQYALDTSGAAAVEFAIWLAALLVTTMSVVDAGAYAFQTMQVREAAQTAAQSVFSICNSAATGQNYPVTTNCPNVSTTTARAIHSTSLVTAVSWSNLKEGWYCGVVTGTKVSLTLTGTQNTMDNLGATTGSMASTQPTCTDGAVAGDYIQVNVGYTYRPPFGGLSIVTLLGGAAVNQSAWMRIN
jgi:Flp pilus assembly protein TadG